MSAPDTNVEKQERRHKPALLGIRGVLVIVALLTIVFVFYLLMGASGPDEAETGGMEGATMTETATETVTPATDDAAEPAPISE